MSSSYNFKNEITLDNNKFINWLDSTGLSRSNLLSYDTSNNFNINSSGGSIHINKNATSSVFINTNNTVGSVIVYSKLGVGITNSSVTNYISIIKNGYIAPNTNDGFMGLSGSDSIGYTYGSSLNLYGNSNTRGGTIDLIAGNTTSGNINLYTSNSSLKARVLNDGSFISSPNGSTDRLVVSDTSSIITNNTILMSTTASLGVGSGGALTVYGGGSIGGDLYVGGNVILTANPVKNNTTIGSFSGGVFKISDIPIGRTMSNTNYKIFGNVNTINSNSQVFSVSFSGLTTTTFAANIIRLDSLFSANNDTSLRLSWYILD